MIRTVAQLMAHLEAVNQAVPNREVPEDFERPACPYCDRELGTAPGHGGIAWKCPAHGTFPAAEFDANPLDAMQQTAEESGPPSTIEAALALVVYGIPLLAALVVVDIARRVASYFTP